MERAMQKFTNLAIFTPVILAAAFINTGCGKTEAKAPAPQPLPVKVETINLAPVPRTDEYVATVKSRRSASIQPQVDGTLARILVKSGDRVRTGQVLMTIDPLKQQATEIRMGIPVQVVTSSGELIEKTKIDFISQQVDNALQGILVKAPIHAPLDTFRNSQLVKARVVWSTSPAPTVPVLAITRIGGQSFVYVAASSDNGTVARQRAVSLGDTIGNDYAVSDGLKAGDKVIVSGTQFLVDGMPVRPLS